MKSPRGAGWWLGAGALLVVLALLPLLDDLLDDDTDRELSMAYASA